MLCILDQSKPMFFCLHNWSCECVFECVLTTTQDVHRKRWHMECVECVDEFWLGILVYRMWCVESIVFEIILWWRFVIWFGLYTHIFHEITMDIVKLYSHNNMVPMVNYKNTTHGTTNNKQHRYSQNYGKQQRLNKTQQMPFMIRCMVRMILGRLTEECIT